MNRNWNKNKDRNRNQQQTSFDEQWFPKILDMHRSATNELIDKIKKFVENNARDITTSQLRNIFGDIKKAELHQLPLKRPKLAYIMGRTDNRKKGMFELLNLLDDLLKEIGKADTKENQEEKRLGFLAFFEAVLAYHKFFEKVKQNK